MIMLIILMIVVFVYYLLKIKKFNKTTYHKITKNPYFYTILDMGRCGEYLIYDSLKDVEKQGSKFLFNVYLPKKSGETTEIDVMLITHFGIFIFESKNYSGIISGNEFSLNWLQTIITKNKKRYKTEFYNPIMQNKTHINALINLLEKDIPIYSLIVFSERCKLKKITVSAENTYVIKLDDIRNTIAKINKNREKVLTDEEINEIYNLLYPYSQVSEEVKKEHIEKINEKYK